MLNGAGIGSAAKPRAIAAWRGLDVPPALDSGVVLNAPTLGTITEPYGARTLSVLYTGAADDVLRYAQIATASGTSWQVLARVRGLSAPVGFAGMGIGVKFSGGVYVGCHLIRNNLNTSIVSGCALYNAAGTQTGTSNSDGTSGDAWSVGRWLRVSWDASANVLGAGVGEITMETSIDGFNFDPVVARYGNLVATGTAPTGVGPTLAPFSPINANYTLRMAIESFRSL